MKKQQSFKAKITILVTLPLISFVILAGFRVEEKLGVMGEANRTSANLRFLQKASQLVHETQKERGLTSGYLSGSAQISDLEAQRKVNDGRIVEIKKEFDQAELGTSRSGLEQELQTIAAIRSDVNARRISAPEAIAKYTKVISEFLHTYTVLADKTDIASIESRMRTLSALELAKESAGRLRAALFGVLSKNEPLKAEGLSNLLDLKARIEASLDSPALVLDSQEQDGIAAFKASSEWSDINHIFLETVTKATVGRYNQNPKAYFETMTQAMNRVADIVNMQFDETERLNSEFHSRSQRDLILLSALMVVVCVFLLSVAAWQIRATSRSLEGAISRLTTGSNQVAAAAQQIAASGTELSQSVTEQSAAIQETAASVDEIQAMVEKNRDASARSKETSSSSTRTSQSGKHSVDKMIKAISEISQSNNEIAHQMEEGNREIEEIVKVIAEIGNKTKVINDIVFQTKLLSFNASVEAARAGEHGKGFAVVAEEVGNLAQMSGNASKEISAMLDSSINKVEQIVQKTRTRLGDLVTLSKDKVEQGNAVAAECGKALDQILVDVSSVDTLVSEIAIASREQAQGISEVTKAMGQLDQATQQNSAVAQQAASAGESLSAQSNDLNMVVAELRQLVSGGVMIYQPPQAGERSKKKREAASNVVVPMHAKAKITTANFAPRKIAVGNGVPSNEDPNFEDI